MSIRRHRLVPAGATTPTKAYSHGMAVDINDTARVIFTMGQIAIDDDGNVISEDLTVQTRYVFDQITAILESGGAALNDIVKVQIFLTDIGDFPTVSAIRNEYLGDIRPASTLLEVGSLVRPTCRIEVEAIAITTDV